MNIYDDKKEKDILKYFPDKDFNKYIGPSKNKFGQLLTPPGHPQPLFEVTNAPNDNNIIGLSTQVHPEVFNKGGKRKTKRRKKAGGPKNKTRIVYFKDDIKFSNRFPSQALKLMEEGRANQTLSLTMGPTPGEPVRPWDIENQVIQYTVPIKSIIKKGGKRKKSIKHKRKSNKRKSKKRKSKKAGGPCMSIPQAEQEPDFPTIHEGDVRLRRINPNGPFSDLEAKIYPNAEANINPYHNPILVIVPQPKKK